MAFAGNVDILWDESLQLSTFQLFVLKIILFTLNMILSKFMCLIISKVLRKILIFYESMFN